MLSDPLTPLECARLLLVALILFTLWYTRNKE